MWWDLNFTHGKSSDKAFGEVYTYLQSQIYYENLSIPCKLTYFISIVYGEKAEGLDDNQLLELRLVKAIKESKIAITEPGEAARRNGSINFFIPFELK